MPASVYSIHRTRPAVAPPASAARAAVAAEIAFWERERYGAGQHTHLGLADVDAWLDFCAERIERLQDILKLMESAS